MNLEEESLARKELVAIGRRIDNLKDYRWRALDLTQIDKQDIQCQMHAMYQYHAALTTRLMRAMENESV